MTATAESRATAAVVICANIVCAVALGHLYKIVCLGQILERSITVTQDSKLK
jgi:hypothetical protein